MTPLVVHGWTLFAHPLFLDQIALLVQQVAEHAVTMYAPAYALPTIRNVQ